MTRPAAASGQKQVPRRGAAGARTATSEQRGSPEVAGALRQTFLLHFNYRPEAFEIARQLGLSLTELALAVAACLGDPAARTRDELQAAAADLRALQSFLFEVGREYLDRDLTPAERPLSRLGGKLATRVGGIAATIEEALRMAALPLPHAGGEPES
ncbi:MAG: hypothetical protein ACRD2T_09655 [Thermoanaerobaculia bacterium]